MPTETTRSEYEDFRTACPEAHAALRTLGQAVDDGGLEKELTELVKLRVSQLNGCAFCIQLHLNISRKLGIQRSKLDLVAAWRDAGVFTPRESSALAWTELLTRLNGDGAPEADWAALLEHFTVEEATLLTVTIGTINNWNRIAIGLRFAPPLPGREAA
jgi:AhpD family alkylhydroperoxidase